jgi:hypothetical protein
VDGVLTSGRYTRSDLIRLAADHDPGFEPAMFAEALAAVDRVADSAFAVYDLGPAEAAALRGRLTGWAGELRDEVSGSG